MKFYIIATAMICMFCQFGALGSKDDKTILLLLFIPFVALVICIWRCTVISRRRAERRAYERAFTEYMRTTRGFRR